MLEHERTRDIYEDVGGFPKAPMMPLPDPYDLSSLETMDIRRGSAPWWILKASMRASGIGRYHKKYLPENLEHMLRSVNIREGLFFPPVFSAMTVLANDPRQMDPIKRAATLVYGFRTIFEDLNAGEFEADMLKGQVLEMGQYSNLFSTSTTWEGRTPRLFKSSRTDSFTTALSGNLYFLNTWDRSAAPNGNDRGTAPDEITSDATGVDQIYKALLQIVEQDKENLDLDSPCLLSCAKEGTQKEAFTAMQKSELNCQSIETLRHSFFTLCLDLDSFPVDYGEAGQMAQGWNLRNRWANSSIQIVVFGNGMAAVVFNFATYIDGNTMMRSAAEIQKRGAACVLPKVVESGHSLPKAKLLRWEINANYIEKAKQDLQPIRDKQKAVFELPGMGKEYYKQLGFDGVSTFIVALQMTTKEFTGKLPRIRQLLAISKYRYMDLAAAVVTTPEVIRFIDYLETGGTDAALVKEKLKAAVDSQLQTCRIARKTVPIFKITEIVRTSLKGFKKFYTSFIHVFAMRVLWLMGTVRPDIIVSHPVLKPEVRFLGRPGVRLNYMKYYALHYSIIDDKTIISMMPGLSWKVSNEEFVAALKKNLDRIEALLNDN